MGDRRRRHGPLTRFLIARFAEREDSPLTPTGRRAAYGLLEGVVSIVVNTVLFAIKLMLGLMSGSIALLADAVHTASDSVTSLVVVVGAWAARRPPDLEHPYGHGRAESVAAVMIAVLLGVAALEFGKTAVFRILDPTPVTASWFVISLVLGTAVVKEWLSRFALGLARESGNQAIEADAWHHRSDVFATGLVALGMVGAQYGLELLDGVMGIAVALLLAKVAWDVARRAIDTLLGERPSHEEIDEAKRAALAVAEVKSVHDVVIHKYGEVCFLSLHVVTSDRLSAAEAHRVAAEVERSVARGGHGSVCVHVDPIDLDHPAYAAVRAAIGELVAREGAVEGFHDLRVLGEEPQLRIEVDLALAPGLSDVEDAIEQAEAFLVERFPGAVVEVQGDPQYAYS